MALDYKALLNFQIPEVLQTLTKRDTVLYALSVGLGHVPTDESQLDFVDAGRDLKALPSMAIVLGYPGFWLSGPKTGVNARMVVHGEQHIAIRRSLPVEGEFIGRTKVTGLVDKGFGRGALLYSEKQLINVANGELLATTRSTTFLRGDGGFGGPSGPIAPQVATPEGKPDIIVDLPTRPEQALYYRLNGDDNPLHADPKVASAAGFSRPILHGLCTFGVVCHALVRELGGYDPSRLKEMQVRFSAPVLPGDTIRTEIWRDGRFRARVVESDQLVITNGLSVFS